MKFQKILIKIIKGQREREPLFTSGILYVQYTTSQPVDSVFVQVVGVQGGPRRFYINKYLYIYICGLLYIQKICIYKVSVLWQANKGNEYVDETCVVRDRSAVLSCKNKNSKNSKAVFLNALQPMLIMSQAFYHIGQTFFLYSKTSKSQSKAYQYSYQTLVEKNSNFSTIQLFE